MYTRHKFLIENILIANVIYFYKMFTTGALKDFGSNFLVLFQIYNNEVNHKVLFNVVFINFRMIGFFI